jgi:hypothetical protein
VICEFFEADFAFLLHGLNACGSSFDQRRKALIRACEKVITLGQDVERNHSINVSNLNLKASPLGIRITELAPLFVASEHLSILTTTDLKSATIFGGQPVTDKGMSGHTAPSIKKAGCIHHR